MKRFLSCAAIAAAVALPASGAEQPIIHGIKAKCTVSRVLGEPMRCDSQLVIMTLPQAGRTIMLMTLARADGSKITLAFSGGRDEQKTLQDYTLFLDTVRVASSGGGPSRTEPVEGTCHEALNDKGTFSFSTSCIAHSKSGGAYELSLGSGEVD